MIQTPTSPPDDSHEDPVADALDPGHRVGADPRFRAELRDRLVAVAVPPPAGSPSGLEVQPWMPIAALAVGALVIGVFVAGRYGQAGSAPPPAPTANLAPGTHRMQPATDGGDDPSGIAAPPVERRARDSVQTEPAKAQQPVRLAATATPAAESPNDLVAVPSADAKPTEEEEEDAPTSQPSPSPTGQLDPSDPPTAVPTSTAGPTSLPRPTATPVSPTPGVPGGG